VIVLSVAPDYMLAWPLWAHAVTLAGCIALAAGILRATGRRSVGVILWIALLPLKLLWGVVRAALAMVLVGGVVLGVIWLLWG
jgi:hypothetical protein